MIPFVSLRSRHSGAPRRGEAGIHILGRWVWTPGPILQVVPE
jgi:hypothetical protein